LIPVKDPGEGKEGMYFNEMSIAELEELIGGLEQLIVKKREAQLNEVLDGIQELLKSNPDVSWSAVAGSMRIRELYSEQEKNRRNRQESAIALDYQENMDQCDHVPVIRALDQAAWVEENTAPPQDAFRLILNRPHQYEV
jgi:hypothetical protein